MFWFLSVLAIAEVAFALPTNQTYDVSVGSPTVKIVGGHAVNIADYPWQISLQYRNQHFCGGFLISSRWVVTAAHCIVDGYSTNLNIRAGSASTTTGGQSILVQGYIVHPGYSVYSYDHDIALLYLASAVTVANARAAILPVAGQALPDQLPVVVTGWGATREGGLGSTALLGVSVPTVNFNTCRNVYGTSLTANMFCAGYLGVGGRDACQGDSGGPAANNGVVLGVVSWGAGCASPLYPGVYVKVSNYRTWITQNTGI